MNPQKLAGQCAKLKCCLNFEVDIYMEASKKLPPKDIALETVDATYFHFKSDILSGQMTYSTDKHAPVNCVTIPSERVREIIAVNKEGRKVDSLLAPGDASDNRTEFVELVGQDNINRFDKAKKKKKRPQPQAKKQHPKEEVAQSAEQQARRRNGERRQPAAKNDKPRQPQKPVSRQQPNPEARQRKQKHSKPKAENEANKQS